MLNKPKIIFAAFCAIFWLEAIPPFFVQMTGAFSFVPSLAHVLAFALVTVLGLWTLRERWQIIGLALFLILGGLSTLVVNRLGMVSFINGVRQYAPLIFTVPVLTYLAKSTIGPWVIRQFDRQLYVFLWIQAASMTIQFLRYGPCDEVGGTLGFASGTMSTIIYVVSFYLINKKWDPEHYIHSLKENWVLVFLLYPTFLNETKISFIYIILYFLLLLRLEMKSVIKIAVASPVAVAAVYGLFLFYMNITGQAARGIDVASSEYMDEYLTGGARSEEIMDIAQHMQDYDLMADEDWGDLDVPRALKLSLIFPMVKNDCAGGMWLGAGLGIFMGRQQMSPSEFFLRNEWLFTGTMLTVIQVYVQLGILGLIWFIYWLAGMLDFRHRAGARAMYVKIYLALVFALIVIYTPSWDIWTFAMIMAYVCVATSSNGVAKELNSNADIMEPLINASNAPM